METINFTQLELGEEVRKDLKHHDFTEAMPIQSESIPHLLEGRDIIAQAKTGTGKTLAFAIPIVERIENDSKGVQALIITPTRELAIQVSDEFRKMAYSKKLSVATVYGGRSIEGQAKQIRSGSQVVVGTPGRLLDLIRRKILHLGSVRMLVLDEADRMLDMGFIKDINQIISYTPKDRQTMLFSATIHDEIRDLAVKITKDPVNISTGEDDLVVEDICQSYYEIPQKKKLDFFTDVVKRENPEKAIIFCNTKHWSETLLKLLRKRGIHAKALHGNMTQKQREKVINEFRVGKTKFLIATDVASRGLDIDGITHVFNYDLPQDPKSYVHRIGRTARAGKAGKAISFINPQEIHDLWGIEHHCRTDIQEIKA